MTHFPRSLTSLGFAVVLTGCPGFGSETLEGPDDIPTWDDDVQAIMMAQCGNCHANPPANGAPGGFDLTAYNRAEAGDVDGAFERLDRILARAVDGSTMPPGGPLSNEDKATLKAWADGGAPESSADTAPTWNNGIGDLLTMRCGVCHTDPPVNGAPGGFRLDVYDSTAAGGPDGAFERADRIRARSVDGTTMPPGGALPASERALLQSWLDAGAPE